MSNCKNLEKMIQKCILLFVNLLIIILINKTHSVHANEISRIEIDCRSSGRGGGSDISENEQITIRIDRSRPPSDYRNILQNVRIMCKPEIGTFFQEWRIIGRIEPFMADVLESIDASIRQNERLAYDFDRGQGLRINIDSSGGDVQAAMRMGRVLRRLNALVVVSGRAQCFSACVIILASGVERWPWGRVGIHRPYFTILGHRESREQVAMRLNRLNSELSAYFQEMGQPGSLLDAMRAVPPDRIRVLTERELESFMLTGEDPAYEERILARDAYRYGITSLELRRRISLAERLCGSGRAGEASDIWIRRMQCFEGVKFGITQETLSARRNRANAECITPLNGRSTEDLSVREIDRLEICIRNIMIGNAR